jgi:hypothetical protein
MEIVTMVRPTADHNDQGFLRWRGAERQDGGTPEESVGTWERNMRAYAGIFLTIPILPLANGRGTSWHLLKDGKNSLRG